GVGARFGAVVSVLNPPAGGAGGPVDLAAARSQLIDAIVEADEELMMKYLEEGTVSAEELAGALPKALASGSCIPVFCTSARKDVGVAELLDAIAQFGLSPAQAKPRTAAGKGGEVTL